VARAIGSTKQAVYKYEMGIVTNIPMDKIEKMACLFGVTPSYLMGWDNTPTKLNLQLFAEENPPAIGEGVSGKRKELIDYALTLSEEQADRALQVLKLIVEGR
jgi:transcriptional regulator with XRE-family HTH domain